MHVPSSVGGFRLRRINPRMDRRKIRQLRLSGLFQALDRRYSELLYLRLRHSPVIEVLSHNQCQNIAQHSLSTSFSFYDIPLTQKQYRYVEYVY